MISDKTDNIEIPKFIPRTKQLTSIHTIPKNIIQTHKTNYIHPFIFNNIVNVLARNLEYDYYFITDEDARELMIHYFDQSILDAFNKIKMGAAQGDFKRYIALYVYGGIYLDLDASIEYSLDDFFKENNLSNKDIVFIYKVFNTLRQIEQWIMFASPKHTIIKSIIYECAARIHSGENDVFLTTGSSMVTSVVYNLANGKNIYDMNISAQELTTFFTSVNDRISEYQIINNGWFINRRDINIIFHFHMTGYQKKYLYQDEEHYMYNYNIFTFKPIKSICRPTITNQQKILNSIESDIADMRDTISKLKSIAYAMNDNSTKLVCMLSHIREYEKKCNNTCPKYLFDLTHKYIELITNILHHKLSIATNDEEKMFIHDALVKIPSYTTDLIFRKITLKTIISTLDNNIMRI